MPGLLRCEWEHWPLSRAVQEEPGQVWLQWWESGAWRTGWEADWKEKDSKSNCLVARPQRETPLLTVKHLTVCVNFAPSVFVRTVSPPDTRWVGLGWVFCMWCFFREELQQLVEMQRHWEAETLRALKSYLKIVKEDGWRARETGDGSRSFLGDIWGGR